MQKTARNCRRQLQKPVAMHYLQSLGKIDWTSRSSPRRPGGSDFSLIGDAGDPGCPGIAHHFVARAEQSSGPFAPWLMIFFSVPGHVNGTSQVSPTERQSSWPIELEMFLLIMLRFLLALDVIFCMWGPQLKSLVTNSSPRYTCWFTWRVLLHISYNDERLSSSWWQSHWQSELSTSVGWRTFAISLTIESYWTTAFKSHINNHDLE